MRKKEKGRGNGRRRGEGSESTKLTVSVKQCQRNKVTKNFFLIYFYVCFVVRWMKPGSHNIPCILGKDVAILASGNLINFIETSRPDKKELIYHANNEVRGDGIQCICTHKTLPCFAFSEMCRNPRILIVSYPNFEVFKSFESK